jgi:uncharacterized protein YehS (DUF1456 family)
MISIFRSADKKVNRAEISDWLKKEEDPDFKKFNDLELAIFLNGLINEKRGKKEGEQPKPEKRLTNNIIFKKLKIALDLKSDDILKILKSAGFDISEHELSSFFRKPGNSHYRECKDQVLRNFLKGIQIKYRDDLEAKPKSPSVWDR